MSAREEPTGLTFGEVRDWAIELVIFTASDLARSLGVEIAIARKCVTALCLQDICVDTGDLLDGPHGYEPVIRYLKPPPGPTTHEHGPDPVEKAISQAGRIIIRDRGEQVRIRTHRKSARGLSTPGQAQKMKNREAAYQRQEEAKRTRAEAQRKKAKQEPKWKKKK